MVELSKLLSALGHLFLSTGNFWARAEEGLSPRWEVEWVPVFPVVIN